MAFAPSVEKWRPFAEMFNADAPTDYLLDWIRGESGGNRCNLTTGAGFNERGLFQLDDGNARSAGVDPNAILVNCSGGRDLGTDDDRYNAMADGVAYVKTLKALAHQRLQAVGTDWSESDPGFWSFVRYHFSAGSGAAQAALSQATVSLGRAPSSWSELVANGNPSAHWADIATKNGLYAQGWSPSMFGGGGRVSRGEIVMISLVSLIALFGAIRFDRWLHAGKPIV